ncbi:MULTISPECIES: cytochrome P450 [unclassified Streptomyces]|uniref:cytochrome P450 n=1 Tax=unclassified Streptomyces TaxID=2593676 RepID=UPI00089165C6|nr:MULTISPECIES: cytochrome P450 [unclassified Streptomyces]PBC82323.1 cytochrome P450 [Streptomyces sp. 2321.6]SDR50259.1 Cytochrome P450 [Streptomyces sp. KS_16]SEC53017.1 Cytochrome P450 [Streptomyces sp. 2133.1]SEE98978.1 Cytochrome P450 [Streptomyces sp. 2112.3]SNC68111.1 Cytochrome P450 [Streptomyces sp. 2114.4]
MTSPHQPGAAPPPGCPAHAAPAQQYPPAQPDAQTPVKLYGPDFAADPHRIYDQLRQYGALAPVEIAPEVTAMLVTDYRAALDLLHDDATWSKDSREWMTTVPADSPVMPMLMWRPNIFYADGPAHVRYRDVVVDSFKLVEPHELRARVHHAADSLIRRFGAHGEVDLIADYARLIPLLMFNNLFGMPDSYSDRLITAIGGMLDGNSPEEAAAANEAYTSYIMELVGMKKAERGPDLTSWFMDHPNALNDEELIHNVILTMGAGNEPLANLIGNALSRMLSDDRYYHTLSGGALTAHDALNEVLWNDPPLANYSAHFPVRDVFFHGTWVRKGQLVMVSYAAANSQFDTTGQTGPGSGGGSHLSWAAGPHACPVKRHALLIATTAIERLTAWLSDIELAVDASELQWRNGAFHRALAALPARFTPITPDQAGATPWHNRDSSPTSSTRSEATSMERPPVSAR